MAPVQIVYSEPSGLLGSPAHTAPPKTITQSMCRTIDRNGAEKPRVSPVRSIASTLTQREIIGTRFANPIASCSTTATWDW
ncbi:MAG: hypothetical protein HC881_09665 [Leptolyngbyaceae cyanobacterium SL_7_1]|nr:hypothetical protein [Leptolyngbyaceae cyanobacterium SL_7_1]